MRREDLPEDADGDAIWRVIEDGSDVSSPMLVDFFVVFESDENAQIVKNLFGRKGFEVRFERDEDEESYTCYCSKKMLLLYQDVIEVQNQLNAVAKCYGGYIDGWGTFGNVDE